MANKFARHALFIAGAAALTLTAALAPQAAFADTTGSEVPETFNESAPMIIVGYDEQVAAANGFQVITNPDGSQYSIAVTNEAKAQLQQAEALRAEAQLAAPAADPVPGNCGSSWASGAKIANDTVAFSTGFLVFLAAYEHDWRVNATGFVTANPLEHRGCGTGERHKELDRCHPWCHRSGRRRRTGLLRFGISHSGRRRSVLLRRAHVLIRVIG